MKRIIFSVAMLVATSFSSTAQLQVTETKTDVIYTSMASVHRLIKISVDSVSQYTFYFRDAQYKQLVDYKYFSFSSKEELIQFFDLVKDVIATGKELSISLNNETILLRKQTGQSAVIFAEGGYFYFTTKQIEAMYAKL